MRATSGPWAGAAGHRCLLARPLTLPPPIEGRVGFLHQGVALRQGNTRPHNIEPLTSSRSSCSWAVRGSAEIVGYGLGNPVLRRRKAYW